MNKKELLEKKNTLIAKFNDLKAKSVKDSLSEDDVKTLSDIKDKIVPINEQLKKLETKKEGVLDNAEKGARVMNKEERKDLAVNVFADMIRGKKNSESFKKYRDSANITTPNAPAPAGGDTSGLIPTEVANNIVEKLSEVSPAYELAAKIPGHGNVSVPREDALADAGFVGEDAAASTLPVTLKKTVLSSKRVGGKTIVTNTMLNDSAVNLTSYVVNGLTRSAGRALDYAILVGARNGQPASQTFTPVIGNNDASLRFTIDPSKLGVEDFLKIQNALNPQYTRNAVWIVSKAVYDIITRLKDGDGSYLFIKQASPTANGVQSKFLNSNIYVSDALTGAPAEVIYGDFGSGYGILNLDGLQLAQINGDVASFDTDTTYFGLNAHTDGAVINPYAFVTASISAATSTPSTTSPHK